jgi:hypothetical protein
VAVAKAFRKSLLHYYPEAKPTFAAFEGYLAAKAVVAALKKDPQSIRRPHFLRALRTLTANDLEGLPVHYQRTQLLNRVYLSIFRDGAFHPAEKTKGTP